MLKDTNTKTEILENGEKVVHHYHHTKNEDTFSYKGWLNSDTFWKRALSTYGYSLAGYLILVLPLLFLVLFFGLFIGITQSN
jgi:hypothetical protein